MRQRAALARALAADPDVLLGDEPFGALDAQARELLQREVQRVWVESNGRKTFLFVTHNVREATLLADRVLVMSASPGRLLEEFRIHAPRPRDLDDVLVARVVSRDPRAADAGGGRECRARDGSLGSSARRSSASPGVVVVWALVAAATNSAAIPSPAVVWSAFLDGMRDGTLPEAAFKTLIRLAFSFVVAVALGVLLGIVLALNGFARRAIRPLVVALQITPFVAWVPLAVIWFGATERAVVFVAIVGSFPAMTLATLQAIRQVPAALRAHRPDPRRAGMDAVPQGGVPGGDAGGDGRACSRRGASRGRR